MRRYIFLLVCLLLMFTPSSVCADVAPPAQPPGSNPIPENESTQVRMLSETVTIEILEDSKKDSLGSAKVTASFSMRNLGDTAESMAVRFPIGVSDGYGGYPEITDMQIKVDYKVAELRRISGEDPNGYDSNVPWVEFDVTFPPEKDVVIQASYSLEGGGELPFTLFEYIFSSGAGWKDTIGSATLFVRFPYDVSELNVLPSFKPTYAEIFPAHQLSSNELKWTFTDFEPSSEDNFELVIASPSVWNKVLSEQENLAKHPTDGESWGRLAMTYKQLSFSSRGKGFRAWDLLTDKGAGDLYHLSIEAYGHAVQYKPYDPLWHAGYADLFAYYSYFAGMEGVDTRAEAVRALEEIRKAIELAPDDPIVLEIAEEMTWFLEGGMVKNDAGEYEYPWLTATPERATATKEIIPSSPTPELVLANTPQRITSTPTIIPTEQKSTENKKLPICGSVILVPLGLLFSFLSLKKKTD